MNAKDLASATTLNQYVETSADADIFGSAVTSGETPNQAMIMTKDKQQDAADSPKYEVGNDYRIDVIPTRQGKYIRVIYAPNGRRTSMSVVLRPVKNGNIQIDYGSRENGGRVSTGTQDWQEAIWFAESSLKTRLMKRLAPEEAKTAILDTNGDPSILSCFDFWLTNKTGVTEKWRNHVRLVRDVIALKFPEERAQTAGEDFIRSFIDLRVNETITIEGRQTLPPTSEDTAIKQVHIIATVLAFCAGFKRPEDPTRKVLAGGNPLTKDILPEKSDSRPKRPRTGAHYDLAMLSTEIDGVRVPAPVDRVPGDIHGQARLAFAWGFGTNMRREEMILTQRRQLALTREDVLALLKRMEKGKAAGVTVELIDAFPHGAIEIEAPKNKEGKRADQNPKEWWRVLPMSKEFRRQLDIYDRKTGLYDFAPDDYVFFRRDNRKRHIKSNKLFAAATVAVARHDGQRTYDSEGNVVRVAKGTPTHDKTGQPRNGKAPGWYRQAEEIVRADLVAKGLNPDLHYALHEGEMFHGWRAGNIRQLRDLGYLRRVEVEGNNGTETVQLDSNAIYVLGWKLPKLAAVKFYLGLEPEIMQGIVNRVHSDIALAGRYKRAADDHAERDKLREAEANAILGIKPNLKLVRDA